MLGAKVMPVAKKKMITARLVNDALLPTDLVAMISAAGRRTPVANLVSALVSRKTSADCTVLSKNDPMLITASENANHLPGFMIADGKNAIAAAAMENGIANAGIARPISEELNVMAYPGISGAIR
ncbi:hypothetical protein GCM10023149_01690 [Mucilaginibacter gynuensis]|uniref:Uncharacterized protein n=1 Tax=Mucilaginibacter gynuensis TaxID=1302236 RepID=A0ABP8FNS1_9SPHI